MTEKLLLEAIGNGSKYCAQASVTGDSIYKTIVFIAYTALETYNIVNIKRTLYKPN